MKKFLLFVAVAMAAMTANAQKAVSMETPVSKAVAASPMQAMTSIVYKNNPVAKNIAKTAGDAIELIDAGIGSAGPDGEEIELVETNTVELYVTNEKKEYNGKEMTVCDINLGSSDWKALWDGTTLVIPVNQTYVDATYGEFIMLSLIEKEDGIYLDDENDVIYTLNPESGKFECNGIGWYIYMNEGDYAGYCWSRSFYSEMLQPNAKESGSLGKGGWSEYENPIFVEDLTDEINMINFFGYTKLNILFDEETGNLLIPMLQPIQAMSSSYDNAVYGYWFRILGVDVDDEGYLRVNEEKEYTDAYFAKINDAGDALVPSTNTIISDPTRDGYMGIFSEFDADGQGYYMGYLHSISFTLNNGEYKAVATGIKNVNKDEVKGNGKVYNLAGQQVSANAKGLVVVNGKKVIK